MNYCKKCNRYDDCDYVWKNTENPVCVSFTPIVTNANKIRSMTDEELAELAFELVDCCYCPLRAKCDTEEDTGCTKLWMEWLKQEAKNEC